MQVTSPDTVPCIDTKKPLHCYCAGSGHLGSLLNRARQNSSRLHTRSCLQKAVPRSRFEEEAFLKIIGDVALAGTQLQRSIDSLRRFVLLIPLVGCRSRPLRIFSLKLNRREVTRHAATEISQLLIVRALLRPCLRFFLDGFCLDGFCLWLRCSRWLSLALFDLDFLRPGLGFRCRRCCRCRRVGCDSSTSSFPSLIHRDSKQLDSLWP
mmetsp:Transcript_62104/g.116147  ORF Transcript_62104/g.116147 Transcript_62104/m.116147 type:complete len:209 (+) Transcript_62104:89-715(+)